MKKQGATKSFYCTDPELYDDFVRKAKGYGIKAWDVIEPAVKKFIKEEEEK